MVGQAMCLHWLQNDFRLLTVRMDVLGPSGQALLISIDAGAVAHGKALGRQPDLGFHLGGHGLSPRQHPQNSGYLYSMGHYGLHMMLVMWSSHRKVCIILMFQGHIL